MESGDDQSSEPLWVRLVIVLGAVALGWLLSEAGLSEAIGAAFWPLLIVGALFVFTLPFHKHIPPMPPLLLPGWLTRWGGFALMIAGNSSVAFCSINLGSSKFFFAALVVGLLVGVLMGKRAGESKESE